MADFKFPMTFPVLKTSRLLLRDFIEGDSKGIFDNFSNLEVTKYLMEPLTEIDVADIFIQSFQEEFKQQKGLTWAIALQENNILIGTCSCEMKPGDRAELGFDLNPGYWGQGYMTETLQGVIKYGFEKLSLKKFVAHTLLLNSRTIHLLVKNAFQVDGVVRENTLLKGQLMDEIFFSLNKYDWELRNTNRVF